MHCFVQSLLVLSCVRLWLVDAQTHIHQACRIWPDVLDDVQANLFDGGQCIDQAREAIRLTFHDGIGRSAQLAASGVFGGGGADGSIIEFAAIELADASNEGLEDIVYALRHFSDSHNVSYGDIIQFVGAVALSNCPGSPRLAFHAGRPPPAAAAPPLIPAPTDSVEKILWRMADAGFDADETVALLAAHSLAVQKTVDPSIPFTPLDTTPGTFDTQFYLETLLNGTDYAGKGANPAETKSPIRGEFRLASDAAVARHSLTACQWQFFVDKQEVMKNAFSEAMLKLANQGHNDLVDCSFVIPSPRSWDRRPAYPPGKGRSDIQQSCPDVSFPTLASERDGTRTLG
ncbi:heme peroxidase [Amylocystis lapponica]|nr:heme peroxidase [Amylocystis lapponica]